MKPGRLVTLSLVLTAICGACAVTEHPTMSQRSIDFAGPPFVNDGGPLMLLSQGAVEDWVGATGEDGLGGDYDRAVAAEGLVDVIPVDTEVGVVLGSEDIVSSAQWIRAGDDWMVVAWYYGDEDSDEQLLAWLRSGAETDWVRLASNVAVNERMTLFHPASSGADILAMKSELVDGVQWVASRQSGPTTEACIGDALIAPTPAAEVSIDWARVQIGETTDCGLIRLTPTE